MVFDGDRRRLVRVFLFVVLHLQRKEPDMTEIVRIAYASPLATFFFLLLIVAGLCEFAHLLYQAYKEKNRN